MCWSCFAIIGVLQWGIWSNRRTWKWHNAQNMTYRNYMFVQLNKLNNMKYVCASSIHFRFSAHICFIVITLRLRHWSAPGTNTLRSSGISHEWNIRRRCKITWIPLEGMRCYIMTSIEICYFFKVCSLPVSQLFTNNPCVLYVLYLLNGIPLNVRNIWWKVSLFILFTSAPLMTACLCTDTEE